jgi:hypothetical protein
LTLALAQAGEQAVTFEVGFVAMTRPLKVLFVICGVAELDRGLCLRLHRLEARGVGLWGRMFERRIRSRVARYEGRTFDLTLPSLEGVRVHEVVLHVGDPLCLEAEFTR